MSKEIGPKDNANYHDAPKNVEQALRSARRIEDTLPPPEELVRKKAAFSDWLQETPSAFLSL